ncbi:enoyl-CoA hydratase/isomerase family protein [Mycobacterium sp. 236(2023)]|uniref:enoyl-CoA hydratase/isomerase family protein n=1 Tax=Mycobacterium sp. 236(2023) TaxID=3038163 RepID=UPI0024156D76|nr:enoyl-CoA hydratase/isomerase family protein [Mycobacterium sp. 236(2023)]MDG4663810.1 enoyl-CoA hydratase/isomerase family protein [Mycobacterium sp. 236(2023)]
MTKFDTIELTTRDYVGIVKLNRPEVLNAIDERMIAEIGSAIDILESNVDIRVGIICGAGRAFSAGHDMSDELIPRETPPDLLSYTERNAAPWWRLWNSRLPWIAQVHGYCLGGANELAMICDMTVASNDVQFGIPDVQFQASPPFNILPWIVGMKKARELILTGRRVGATEALEIGMVNAVVAPDELERKVLELASDLAKSPPISVAMNKKAFNRAYEVQGMRAAIDSGRETFVMLQSSTSEEREEFDRIAEAEGMRAAFAWRDARFAVR